jgi:hypothetical protein
LPRNFWMAAEFIGHDFQGVGMDRTVLLLGADVIASASIEASIGPYNPRPDEHLGHCMQRVHVAVCIYAA